MDFYERREKPSVGATNPKGQPPEHVLFFSTAPHDSQEKIDALAAATTAAETSAAAPEGRHCAVHPVKQGLHWVPPVWLGEGEILKVEVSHTSTKLSIRYDPKAKSLNPEL